MGSIHDKAQELLPWYVTGSLSAHEHDEVERHVRQCLPCRAALMHEQRLRELVESQEDVPLNDEHGVVDLLRKIDTTRGRPRAAWRPALAAGGAALVGVVAVAWFVLVAPGGRGVEGPGGAFSTQSSSDAAAPNRIDILFDDDVGASEIRDIVRSIGGTLIGGPSALGRYTVSVPVESEDELAAVIEKLTRNPRIRFAAQSYTASQKPVTDGQ